MSQTKHAYCPNCGARDDQAHYRGYSCANQEVAERKIEDVALRLFKEAEHLDPSDDSDSDDVDWGWDKLTERKRAFWRHLAREALR